MGEVAVGRGSHVGEGGVGGGVVRGSLGLKRPRVGKLALGMCAVAPGGPGSTLEGMTGVGLGGYVKSEGRGVVVTCVPNRGRALSVRGLMLVETNGAGSLPNLGCGIVQNMLSYGWSRVYFDWSR